MSDANPFNDASHRPFSATATVQAPRPTNTLGLIGLILSLAGVLTCGILFPFGLLVSLLGLFKAPRGLAAAGTVVGFLGTAAICTAVAMLTLTTSRAVASLQGAAEEATTVAVMRQANVTIELQAQQSNAYPEGIEGNKQILGLKDAWRHDLRYETDGEGYAIRSAGKDGEFNTGDDLVLDSDGEFTGRQFPDNRFIDFGAEQTAGEMEYTDFESLEDMEKELQNDIEDEMESFAPSIR